MTVALADISQMTGPQPGSHRRVARVGLVQQAISRPSCLDPQWKAVDAMHPGAPAQWQSPGIPRAHVGRAAGAVGGLRGSASCYGGWSQSVDPIEEAPEQLAGSYPTVGGPRTCAASLGQLGKRSRFPRFSEPINIRHLPMLRTAIRGPAQPLRP